ncbi:MAG: hypothetical protein II528_03560, partial [Lachnospiraceae bacterium]|nr:hypothetical protein [Lachnospiraceae bacterium]
MRITNNMIMNNSSGNINGTKGLVNSRNTQMTTQKKIDRPSEDPVIAVRSLRLQTSLSKVNQYYEKNIPDADSWMDVTETALLNIRDIMTDFRTLCVNGSTGTLTQDDRNTIATQLKALQEAVFSEGNADYAGRTVFTGFRTDKNLTFTEAEKDTKYTIEQRLKADDMVLSRYYNNEVTVPTNVTEVADLKMNDADTTGTKPADQFTIQQSNFYRLRLGYDQIDSVEKMEITMGGTTNPVTPEVFETEEAWAAAHTTADGKKDVPADVREQMAKMIPLENAWTKALTSSPFRGDFEAEYGKQLFRLMDADLLTEDEKIVQETIEVGNICQQYRKTTALASTEFRGEKSN